MLLENLPMLDNAPETNNTARDNAIKIDTSNIAGSIPYPLKKLEIIIHSDIAIAMADNL